MSTPVVEVEDLRKSYGARRAVAGISFVVAAGEIVGLLGPNGAGKTTTVEILEGLRRRDSGVVRVLGHDPARRDRRFNAAIGVVPQLTGIDGELTVRETIGLYATFYRPRAVPDALIDEVGLRASAHERLASLSGGQRRRVDLALALLGEPEVLFLDEPTTGLDPASRRATWEVISNLRARGAAVVLTSHYLEEVQRLADRVVVLREGRIVADDTPEGIVGQSGQVAVITFRLAQRRALPPGPWRRVPANPGAVELVTEDPTEAIFELGRWARASGLELIGLEVRHRSLEERYLELTSET